MYTLQRARWTGIRARLARDNVSSVKRYNVGHGSSCAQTRPFLYKVSRIEAESFVGRGRPWMKYIARAIYI